MAWTVVSKIKNALNEYTFATFPLKNYAGNAGGSSTNIYIGGSRQYNDSRESAAYAEGKAFLNDLLSQGADSLRGKFSFSENNYTSYDKYVYGDAGGSALRLQTTITNNAQKSFSNMGFRILNFSSVALNGGSGSYSANDGQMESYVTAFGLVMNDEEQKIYYCEIMMGNYHYRADLQPAYYDAIDGFVRVWDGLSASNLWNVFKNSVPSGGGSADPYADGGYSTGTDTGTGTFDDSSESVALPTTYAYSATAAGLISQYVVTEAELRTFGAWLWYGGSIIDDLKHFFQSPMEAIFSVGMLPFTPSDTTNYNIYVGSLDANTTGKLVNDTVEKISMGSITFDGYYGSALDFNPYTKIEIFLPYCGNFALNPDEVMGHTISVDYYCDSVSGDCVAFVSDEDRVLYQVKGNCFVQIPLAARDFTAQYASAIGAVGTVAAGLAASVASGGMSAPIAVGMGTSMASNAMNAKTHIARAGGVSGMASFMSIQNPYVIITIPNQCLPEFQAEHQGYPLFVTKALKEFSGFTKVYEIHLDGLDCTDAEAKEIYDLLKGGVIL